MCSKICLYIIVETDLIKVCKRFHWDTFSCKRFHLSRMYETHLFVWSVQIIVGYICLRYICLWYICLRYICLRYICLRDQCRHIRLVKCCQKVVKMTDKSLSKDPKIIFFTQKKVLFYNYLFFVRTVTSSKLTRITKNWQELEKVVKTCQLTDKRSA